MKSFLLFAAILCAVVLSSSAPLTTEAASAAKKERATVVFNDPVKLMGITLQGEYLFVHDDEAMLRGDACTRVYRGAGESASKLVASFHCLPQIGHRVSNFTVRTRMISPGEYEVTDYQFAGSVEAHRVPVNHPSTPVAIAH